MPESQSGPKEVLTSARFVANKGPKLAALPCTSTRFLRQPNHQSMSRSLVNYWGYYPFPEKKAKENMRKFIKNAFIQSVSPKYPTRPNNCLYKNTPVPGTSNYGVNLYQYPAMSLLLLCAPGVSPPSSCTCTGSCTESRTGSCTDTGFAISDSIQQSVSVRSKSWRLHCIN